MNKSKMLRKSFTRIKYSVNIYKYELSLFNKKKHFRSFAISRRFVLIVTNAKPYLHLLWYKKVSQT